MRVPTLLLTARRVSELSQALPLGLTIGLQPEDIEPTKTCYQRIVTAYYTALLASNKEVAEFYSYEECWQDFLLGTVLWGFAYTTPCLQTLPTLEEGTPAMEAWRAVLPRVLQCWAVLELMPFCEQLLSEAQERSPGTTLYYNVYNEDVHEL